MLKKGFQLTIIAILLIIVTIIYLVFTKSQFVKNPKILSYKSSLVTAPNLTSVNMIYPYLHLPNIYFDDNKIFSIRPNDSNNTSFYLSQKNNLVLFNTLFDNCDFTKLDGKQFLDNNIAGEVQQVSIKTEQSTINFRFSTSLSESKFLSGNEYNEIYKFIDVYKKLIESVQNNTPDEYYAEKISLKLTKIDSELVSFEQLQNLNKLDGLNLRQELDEQTIEDNAFNIQKQILKNNVFKNENNEVFAVGYYPVISFD